MRKWPIVRLPSHAERYAVHKLVNACKDNGGERQQERRENTKESDSKVEQVGGTRGDKPDGTKSSKMQVEGSH